MKEREVRMIDINAPTGIEVLIKPTTGSPGLYTLWVNVDGICRLRATEIVPGTLKLDGPEGP